MASNLKKAKVQLGQTLLMCSFAMYGCNDVSPRDQTQREFNRQNNSKIAKSAAMTETEDLADEAKISEPVMVAGAFLTCFFNGDLSGASCLVFNPTTSASDFDRMNKSAKIIVSSDTGESFTFNKNPESSGNALRFDLAFKLKMGSMYSVSIDFGNGNDVFGAELDARSFESIIAATEPADSTMTEAVNLVVNGSFEEPALQPNYAFLSEIEGWAIGWSSDEDPCNVVPKLEIAKSDLQVYGFMEASHDSQFVELAFDCQENKSSALKITQQVDTSKSHFYALSFDWVGRHGNGTGFTKGLRFEATFEDLLLVDEEPKDQWQKSCFIVKASDQGSIISFAETSDKDGHGTILDNVKLIDIDENIAANRHLIPEGCTLILD